ncbi:MAG: hypothetical protein A2Y25_03570 [Candidatus Melainabacteria bacterium GWF2_37_15]|nr:MAG: hypothetical protein A2Y25_03570 [Candidatus Melainabacteria bacterium GWF2_37_15]
MKKLLKILKKFNFDLEPIQEIMFYCHCEQSEAIHPDAGWNDGLLRTKALAMTIEAGVGCAIAHRH